MKDSGRHTWKVAESNIGGPVGLHIVADDKYPCIVCCHIAIGNDLGQMV